MSFPPHISLLIFASKTAYYARYTNIYIRPYHSGTHASADFTSKTSEVFKEENDIAPIFINERMKYIPWGGDNQMPYKISALTILQYINFINNKPISRIKYALN